MGPTRGRRRLDVTSLIGVPIGVGLVLLGQLIEGGAVASLFQLTAGVIVFGGTLGAVLVSYSRRDVASAAAALPSIFFEDRQPIDETIAKLANYAARARRHGIISLQHEIEREADPYLRKGLMLAVDGINPLALRDTLEIEDLTLEEREERPARVFESAGGYAPTLGILGAVLGLIHVMEHLADPAKLGAGIAVAFVATVYGVGSANLIFLPIASKLQAKAQRAARHREIALEGILSIQEGLNPHLLQQKLEAFVEQETPARNARRGRLAA